VRFAPHADEYKLAYIAGALAWMAFRFVLGSVFQKDPMLLAWAAGFGAVAWGILVIAAHRETKDYTRRRW
jgi:hypothetical protein